MFPGDEPDPRELLEELVGRPSWQRDGLCVEHPDVDWFPGRGESLEPARVVCAGCLVADDCLAFALADTTLQGVWSGTSDRQRLILRRQAA